MQKKSLIKQNILQYIEYKNISRYKLYQETGITRGVLDQNNGMSEENTAKFLACFGEVNPEWLLTGKGSMLKADGASPNAANSSAPVTPEESYKDKYIMKLEEENQRLYAQVCDQRGVIEGFLSGKITSKT